MLNVCVPTPEQDVKETDFLHAIQSKRPIIKRNSPWLSSLRNFLAGFIFQGNEQHHEGQEEQR
jgi:hypothetical protein